MKEKLKKFTLLKFNKISNKIIKNSIKFNLKFKSKNNFKLKFIKN